MSFIIEIFGSGDKTVFLSSHNEASVLRQAKFLEIPRRGKRIVSVCTQDFEYVGF